MATQKFDELNNLRSMPYEQYFGEMGITDKQKKERIALAEELEDIFDYLFLIIMSSSLIHKDLVIEELYDLVSNRYTDLVKTLPDIEDNDEYIESYIKDISKEIVDATINHINDKYYTSEDRATLISEEESNTVYNYVDELRAMAQGKTRKTWVTMGDNRVRGTHKDVDRVTIGIFEKFRVGNSLMMRPRDPAGEPQEVIGCRCWIEYTW